MFQEKDKSSFKYWFAHWCAYQMTALNLGVWKFKYLFHDIEKPFLELFWKDHKRVKQWHRAHNIHHICYTGKKKKDYEAIIIDWECARFTKSFRGNNAQQELYNKYYNIKNVTDEEYAILISILKKFGLYKEIAAKCANCAKGCKREKVLDTELEFCEEFVDKR